MTGQEASDVDRGRAGVQRHESVHKLQRASNIQFAAVNVAGEAVGLDNGQWRTVDQAPAVNRELDTVAAIQVPNERDELLCKFLTVRPCCGM
jgi:hypothetical protein